MSVDIDVSEVRNLATGLAMIPGTVMRGVQPVVSKGALNIKNQLRQEMSGSTSFKGVTPGISYELRSDASGVEALVGPTKGRPGSLANIAYFGTSRGGGTVPDPSGALAAEGDQFEQALGALLDGVL